MSEVFENLHPLLESIARDHFFQLTELLKKLRPDITARVSETWRSPERQMTLYKQGRKLENGIWVKVGATVTNARPWETPHCFTLKNGSAAALAWDTLLLKDGKLLPDPDPAWHLIPGLAALVGGDKIQCGADFRSIRDYPHVEWKEWKKIPRE